MKMRKIDLFEIKARYKAYRKSYRKTLRKLRRFFRLDQQIRSVQSDAAMAVPFSYAIAKSSCSAKRIAVICHIYYDDISEEIFSYLQNLECSADIYISTDCPKKKMAIIDVFRGWTSGTVEVHLVENRGRDIAPKLIEFADVYENQELILFLHSKRSTHAKNGNDWRKFLFHNLVGSVEITRSILEIFEQQPNVGVVLAQHWEPLRQWIIWNDTFELAEGLCRRMGIRLHRLRAIDFPSGSMFWIRARAMKALLALKLENRDFPEENGQVGNTIAHAIERLFLICCERSGFDWVKIAVPSLYKKKKSIVEIRSPDQVAHFIKKHNFELLPRHGKSTASGALSRLLGRGKS